MKKFVLWMMVTSICHHLSAQSLMNFNGEYTTELQTDFKKSNWVNLLRLQLEMPFGSQFRFTATSISIAKTREERLANDYLTFSNIEEDNRPFAMVVCGIEWCRGGSRLFAGIRNVNEDYFTSPVTSLFTNSSCGIFPTLSYNNSIANYPLASVGIHYEFEMRKWLLQGSLYNGIGYNNFSGRENIFRFCPKTDGIFGIISINYQNKGSNYHLGAALHSSLHIRDEKRPREQMLYEAANALQKYGYINGTLWGYVEQKIATPISVMLQYSFNTNKKAACRFYSGIGAVYSLHHSEIGLFGGYASFSHREYELAAELTWKIHCFKNGYIQPVLHLVENQKACNIIGMVRFGYNLNWQ